MFFFFNDTATTEIYTLSLHDALPILLHRGWWTIGNDVGVFTRARRSRGGGTREARRFFAGLPRRYNRSEEHTSELQSLTHLVCRLLLEKKKNHESRCGPSHTSLALRR